MSVKKYVLTIAIIIALFPYTQLFPIDTYTQPYSILFAILSCLFCQREFFQLMPGRDVFALLSLAFFGIIAFIISCLPFPLEQDYKYLLMYISPLFFAVATFSLANYDQFLFRKIVNISAIIWISVGLIQTFINPVFATHLVGDWGAAAEVSIASGRGVLGLAPEPTHYGFHMLLIAAIIYISRGSSILILACIVTAIAIAKSSSALLAMLIGGFIFFIFNFKKILNINVFLISTMCLIIGFFLYQVDAIDFGENRIISLLTHFLREPMTLLYVDNSVNARVGGVFLGAELVWNSFFLANGMSSSEWLALVPRIRSDNPWLYDISSSGIPSGIIIVAYQLGAFGLIAIAWMMMKIIKENYSLAGFWLLASTIAIFLGQYLISNPGFGMLYGCTLAVIVRQKKRCKVNI